MKTDVKIAKKNFEFILDERLNRIVCERKRKLGELEKRKNETDNELNKMKIEGEKNDLALHEYTIPFLDILNLLKKEEYFTKQMYKEYHQKYLKAIGYKFKTFDEMQELYQKMMAGVSK